MASDLEKKAKEAFVDDDFELAVDLYSQALELDPTNALLYADRAQAYIKLDSFTEAVSDATKAIQLDPSMSKAYFRKGTACMKLEEYQTAKAALEAGAALVPEDNKFTKLIKECDERIAGSCTSCFASMKIGKANVGNLTNLEVFDFLRSRGATSDPMGCIGSISPLECKVFEYLSGSPACMQTRESVNEFLIKADKFKFITTFEKLNIVNSTPTVMPALYATIKDCDKRIAKEKEQIAKENQLEEDQLQELLELVKEIFPIPAEEQEELSQ